MCLDGTPSYGTINHSATPNLMYVPENVSEEPLCVALQGVHGDGFDVQVKKCDNLFASNKSGAVSTSSLSRWAIQPTVASAMIAPLQQRMWPSLPSNWRSCLNTLARSSSHQGTGWGRLERRELGQLSKHNLRGWLVFYSYFTYSASTKIPQDHCCITLPLSNSNKPHAYHVSPGQPLSWGHTLNGHTLKIMNCGWSWGNSWEIGLHRITFETYAATIINPSGHLSTWSGVATLLSIYSGHSIAVV